MKTILAIYRGETVAEAKIIAVSTDPQLVALVCGKLLAEQESQADPVIDKLQQGRRGALRAIQREAKAEESLPDILRIIRDEAMVSDTRSEEEGFSREGGEDEK